MGFNLVMEGLVNSSYVSMEQLIEQEVLKLQIKEHNDFTA